MKKLKQVTKMDQVTDETLEELTDGRGDDNEQQQSGELHQDQPEQK